MMMTYIENWEKVLHRCCVLLGHGQFAAATGGDTERLRQTKFLLIAGARKRMHGAHTHRTTWERSASASREEWQEAREPRPWASLQGRHGRVGSTVEDC